MEKVYNRIIKDFKANGEEDKGIKYATYFSNKQEVFDNEQVEWLERISEESIDNITFPVIIFDGVSSGTGVYFEYEESDSLEENIYKAAEEYFNRK